MVCHLSTKVPSQKNGFLVCHRGLIVYHCGCVARRVFFSNFERVLIYCVSCVSHYVAQIVTMHPFGSARTSCLPAFYDKSALYLICMKDWGSEWIAYCSAIFNTEDNWYQNINFWCLLFYFACQCFQYAYHSFFHEIICLYLLWVLSCNVTLEWQDLQLVDLEKNLFWINYIEKRKR